MTRPLFLFRPEPGWSQTARAARSLGLEVVGAPLFVVEPVAWTAPDADGFDALLAGSANAFRHGGAQLATLHALPVHCVGEATAKAARDAGFGVEQVGGGSLQPLFDELAGRTLRILRLAGAERVDLTAPPGIAVEDRVVYRAVRRPLGSAVADRLSGGGVAALHSGLAAQAFAEECDRLDVGKAALSIVALAPRVADLAGPGWRSVDVALRPNDRELLALAQRLCQTG